MAKWRLKYMYLSWGGWILWISDVSNLRVFSILSFENYQVLSVPSFPCSLGRRVMAGWEGHQFCATATRLSVLQTLALCSEDPDLEELTHIYLRICVCVQLSRPINQQDKQTALKWDSRCNYLCGWWVWLDKNMLTMSHKDPWELTALFTFFGQHSTIE